MTTGAFGVGSMPRLVAMAAASGLLFLGPLAVAVSGVPVAGTPATEAGATGTVTGLQQQDPEGRTIVGIEIEGNQLHEDDVVRFYMAQRVGAAFSAARAQQDFRTLLNTGFFDDLVMSWRPADDGEGVVVIVEVVERPYLRQVLIRGTDKVDAEDFLERMGKLEMPVSLDRPVERQRLRRGREVLTAMLQGEEGLQFVQVDLETPTSELGAGVDAVYRVVEGDETRIAQATYTGNTVFSDRELRWAGKRTGEHWLGSFLTKNDRFSWGGFQSDIQQIANLYRSRGYLDFQPDEPEIEVFDVDRFWFLGPQQRLFVTIPLYEGVQYRLGEVTVEGNEAVSDDELIDLFPLEEGDPVDVERVVATKDAMESIYGTRGYLEVAVFPVPDTDPETGVADLTFRVEENAIFHVRRIEFEGNTHTRDYVMRRNLRLHENEVWNQELFAKSLFKVRQLGYFQDMRPELEPLPPPQGEEAGDDGGEAAEGGGEGEQVVEAPQPRQVDVTVKIQEVGRNQITFGGGVSQLEGGFVQFGYTTRNLFGRGQTLSFFGQFGSRRQNGRISYFEPYLFGKRLRFGVDVFRDALDFEGFKREGTGASARVGLPLDREEFVTAFVEYNYEFIDIGDIAGGFGSLTNPLFSSLFLEEGRRTTSSLRPFLLWNTIDNPFNPSRGTRTVASVEVAGGQLGGTLDFWKATASTSWYIPTVTDGIGVLSTPRQIFAFNVEARWADSYGDIDQLPIFERFFLGGSQSIRGTRLRAVGPRDERGNILGGTKSLQYNLEYIFQLADPLRLVLFHDAGQAWADDETPSFGSLRKTYGVEFRVFAPVFNIPFRFFWAYNPDPFVELGEDKSTFEFAIGTTF